MAAHRYWRLFFLNPVSSSAGCNVSEVEMRESIGGADACTGGTAISSGDASGTYAASKAFDNDTSTGNGWSSAGSTGPNHWIGYDFGSGVTKDIAEIVVSAPAAYDSNITSLKMPYAFALQWSDDNVTWSTVSGGTFSHPFTAGTSQAVATPAFDGTNQTSRQVPQWNNYRKVETISNTPLQAARADRFSTLSRVNRRGWRPYRWTSWSGSKYIAGSTTSLGDPVQRTVLLISQKSSECVDRIDTDASGAYSFTELGDGPWTVMGVDQSAQQNNVVYAHVTAT